MQGVCFSFNGAGICDEGLRMGSEGKGAVIGEGAASG